MRGKIAVAGGGGTTGLWTVNASARRFIPKMLPPLRLVIASVVDNCLNFKEQSTMRALSGIVRAPEHSRAGGESNDHGFTLDRDE